MLCGTARCSTMTEETFDVLLELSNAKRDNLSGIVIGGEQVRIARGCHKSIYAGGN